jgi:hypothetical protein
VIADAVGVAHEVEPVGGHPLAVARRGEETVDLPLVRVRARIGLEIPDLFRGRRKTREVEAQAPEELVPFRFRQRNETFLHDRGVDGPSMDRSDHGGT